VEILNVTTELLIDGYVYSIKLVKEWGCCLGKDAFLTDDRTEDLNQPKEVVPDHFEDHGFDEFKRDVEVLLDDMQQNCEVPNDNLKRTEAVIPPDITSATELPKEHLVESKGFSPPT